MRVRTAFVFPALALTLGMALLAGPAAGADGCPKPIITTVPFLNLPCPGGDPRWAQAFAHWDRRDDKKEVEAALKLFQELEPANPDSLDAKLWVMRALYGRGMTLRGEDQIAVMKQCQAKADAILVKDPANIYAKYWRWAAMIFFHEFTQADFAEIRAFGQNYQTLRELPVPADDPLWAEAIGHWDQRKVYDEGKQAIAIFDQLEKKYPARLEPKLWLLRSHYWMHYAEKEKDKKAEWCMSAAEWGRKAVALEPRNPAANYITASALGQYGLNTNPLNYVRYAPEIVTKLLLVMEEDPNYFYGGVSQYFAMAIARAGAVVEQSLKLVGFTREMIEKNAVFAVNYEPRYLRNHYALAEMYNSQGQVDKAKQYLNQVITADPAALKNMEAENIAAQESARELLKEIEAKK